MKKLLFISLLLLSQVVYAANSATVGDTLPIKCSDSEIEASVRPVYVNYDTTSADLTIYTPSTGFAIGADSIFLVEADAANITFKTGSTTITTAQFGANSGVIDNIDCVPFLSSEIGEALIINSDAALTPFVIYIVEYKSLKVR